MQLLLPQEAIVLLFYIKSTCAFPYVKTSLQPLSRKIQGALWFHKSPCSNVQISVFIQGLQKLRVQKFIWKLFSKRTTEISRNFLHKVLWFSRWNQHVWRDFELSININLQIIPEKTICVRRYGTNIEALLFMTKIQNMNNVYFANMQLCIVGPYYHCMLLNSCAGTRNCTFSTCSKVAAQFM
jgi:hypothetical protein